jgi:WD40 repeat protein
MKSISFRDGNTTYLYGTKTYETLAHYTPTSYFEVCNISDFTNQSNEVVENIDFKNMYYPYDRRDTEQMNLAVISADNKYILTSKNNSITILDTSLGTIRFEEKYNDKIDSLTFNNNDSQFAFSHSNKISVYNFPDNSLVSATRPPSPIMENLTITVNPVNATDVFKSISFSPNNNVIAGALNSGMIYFYAAKDGREISTINVFRSAQFPEEKEYYIQLGAFIELENAKSVCRKLLSPQYDVYIYNRKINQLTFYCVGIGPYTNRAQADSILQKIKSTSHDYRDSFIIADKKQGKIKVDKSTLMRYGSL